jgi:hypothetical protein
LNLCGILSAGDRIPAIASTQIRYRDGIPLVAQPADLLTC